MLFLVVIISFAYVSANLNTFSSISPWSIFTIPSSSPTSISILNSPLVTDGIESLLFDLKILFIVFGINAKIKTNGFVNFIRLLTTSDVAKAHFSGLIVDTAFGVNSPITTITTVVTTVAIRIAVAEFSPIILIAKLVPIVATVIFSKLPIKSIVAKKSSKLS